MFEPKPIQCRLPSWLPESIRVALSAATSIPLSISPTKAERKVFKKEKPIKPSLWAEKNRILTTSSLPGPWRNEVTQYLTGIMDAADFPSVREVVLCKAPQTGGSEAIHNFIGYCIDRKPGPVLYVFPDTNTAKDNSKDRILPMIRSSARLRSYLTGLQDDESSLRINLLHMIIYLAWASSPSRLANKPILYAVADEIDKEGFYSSGAETSPLNLIDKRLTTYQDTCKFFKISTPTVESGNIWVEFKSCPAVFDYYVQCPDCLSFHIMKFDSIKWPGGGDADPDEIQSKRLAYYVCPKCESTWNDHKRDVAVRRGHWRDRENGMAMDAYLQSFRPSKIGFHLPSWLSRFVSLSKTAASFIKGLKDPVEMQDFMNAHKAEAFRPARKERTEDRILALKDSRPERRVPGGGIVAGLVAGVDTQDYGFWYEIRAVGYGPEKESWQIRAGFVETFGALAQILWEDRYSDADGIEYLVNFALQDCMGHRTSEVYDFCCANRGLILPTKGAQRKTQPFSYTNQEFYPGSKTPIPGGIRLVGLDTTYYKNALARKLEISPSDPGAWHMSAETTEEWARQLTAEFVNEKGVWECPNGRANHGWDCSVLCLVAADILGIPYWEKPGEDELIEKPEKRKPAQSERRQRW